MVDSELRRVVVGAASLWPVLAAFAALPLASQERTTLDIEAGRVVVGGDERAFGPFAAVDHARGIVYVVDAIEPLSALAVSLEDGSTLAVYGGSRGDGPGELRSLAGLFPTGDGVMVSGGGVINHWLLDGSLAAAWRPSLPQGAWFPSQCALKGQPVVATLYGVARRRPDGSWAALGSRPEGETDPDIFGATRMACIGEVAFVLDERLTAYALDGRATPVELPAEIEEISRGWRENKRPGVIGHPYRGVADDGNGLPLVLLPRFVRSMVYGALIDPNTGCHTIISAPDAVSRQTHSLIGMYRDSAVVAESVVSEREIDGVVTRVLDTTASRIGLYPLRPDGGTACHAASGH